MKAEPCRAIRPLNKTNVGETEKTVWKKEPNLHYYTLPAATGYKQISQSIMGDAE